MSGYSLLFFIFFFIFTGAFSFLINGVFLKFSKNLGMRNIDESAIRWATQTKPALGGISFYLIFLISIVFYKIFFTSPEVKLDIELIGTISASTLGFMMGLADDAYNTKPLLKFMVQVSCGIILILTNNFIRIFPYEILNYILTILWVVGMMNSINMLDNMDAITTSISFFILLCIFFVIIREGDSISVNAILTVGVMGALIGFLFFNFNPSTLYMGDTGSQFLGILLSALSIKYLWNFQESEKVSQNLILVGLAFLLPLADTTTVVINRLLKGSSPFIGGRDHTTHYLNYRGLSEKMVWAAYVFISLVSLALIWIISYRLKNWSQLLFVEFALYGLVVFGLLYINTRITKAKH